MSKTLVIMAAGMGSRFGGDGSKQTAALGPRGEMLMEYSIKDASLAGFDKFVFIISARMEGFFPDLIRSRVASDEVYFAVQSFADLPGWYSHPSERTKPYGTMAAIISAKDLISEPFAVINADDFYGRQSFADLAALMDSLAPEGEACMVTYPLAPTLSRTGGVTRGLCSISPEGNLIGITETRNVCLDEGGTPCVTEADGTVRRLPGDAPASMNIFGFMPWMMDEMVQSFEDFLRSLGDGGSMTAEYPVPVFLDKLMSSDRLTIKVRPTDSPWFGVTYQEDSPEVQRRLAEIDSLYR